MLTIARFSRVGAWYQSTSCNVESCLVIEAAERAIKSVTGNRFRGPRFLQQHPKVKHTCMRKVSSKDLNPNEFQGCDTTSCCTVPRGRKGVVTRSSVCLIAGGWQPSLVQLQVVGEPPLRNEVKNHESNSTLRNLQRWGDLWPCHVLGRRALIANPLTMTH